MKIDEDAIAAIYGKILRACEHFQFLDEAVRKWQDDSPYRLLPEPNANGSKYLLRLRFLKPIPPEWSVALGEAIHNLRSALDECVFHLTWDYTGRLPGPRTTGFPIYTERKRLRGAMGQIKHVGAGPRAFIEALQPYPQRRSLLHHQVRSLNDFWNQDKHRLAHLWGLNITDVQLRCRQYGPHYVPTTFDAHVRHRAIRDGAIAGYVTCDPPNLHVHMNGRVTAFMAIKNPHGSRWKESPGMWGIQFTVAEIAGRLIDALGRQSETIALFDPPVIPPLR